MSSVPLWANEELSLQLPSIRQGGENERFDFKREIPEQRHDLAKELAAFGTSGGGTVLIGVEDDGCLFGVDLPSGDRRDKFAEQLHGIGSTVRPTLQFSIEFAVEDEKTVVAVVVSKQQHPVFYYDDRPYVRDKRRARRATPEEVQAAVWAHPSSEARRQREQLQLKEERESQSHRAMMRTLGRIER